MENNINKKTTRRNFIKASALFGGVMILPSCATDRVRGTNDKFSVALIGVGGIGMQAIRNLQKAPEIDIVAGCDVDDKRSAANYAALSKMERFRDVPRFKDYRVLLERMGRDIDGVIVSVPDHMHYPVSSWAMAAGKHTFCQKPLARTIWECREMKRLAAKHGVFTQMGNQGHTNEGWRKIREMQDSGLIGEVEDIYMWTDRPAAYWKQGLNITKPAGEKVPDTLAFDIWLGVAPYQPYNHSFVPHDWCGVQSYGTGAIGGMGCHFMDVPYSAFDLGFPTKITANTDDFNDYSWPYSSNLEFEFDNPRGKNGKIFMHWFDGYRRPKSIRGVEESFINDPKRTNCTVIVCSREIVVTDEYGSRVMIYPTSRMVELRKANAFPQPVIERSISPNNSHLEFARSCLAGKNSPAVFDYAAPFTEMALLGMIATTQRGRTLSYDPKTMSFPNCPQADKYVRSLYEYKEGFIA